MPSPSLASRILQRNPAYLVSAVLMILGVYCIVQPGRQLVGNIPAILATFSTLQVYELLLVGIAIFLVCRRRVMDDGATLVLIEALLVVACFVVADELAFKDRYRSLGLALGVTATLLAAGRLGALGLAVGRRLPFSALGVVIGLLLLWNGAAPSWVAGLHDADSVFTDAACLVGWWVITALAVVLAIATAWQAGMLRGPGEPFVRSDLARWTIAGIVLATAALHQFWVGYILDAPSLLADILPLATVATVGVLSLMDGEGRPLRKREYFVAALPGVLCVLALVTGSFEPLARTLGQVPLRHEFVREMRMLTWPTAWLGVAAAVSALFAWRRRSTGLAHMAAVTLAFAALFSAAKSPERLELDFDAFGAVAIVYFLTAALAEGSPFWAAAALAAINVLVLKYWPDKPVAGIRVEPVIASMATVGLSLLGLWWVFRRRLPAWVAHAGAAFLVWAAIGLGFAPTTRAPGWLVNAWTLLLTGVFVLLACKRRWWTYYGLALLTLFLVAAREVSHPKTALGSPGGWLLVMAAFVALGLGFLISTRKGGSVERTGP